MIFCLSSGDVYISLGNSLSYVKVLYIYIGISKLFCSEFCKTFIILLPITSTVATALFLYSVIIILFLIHQ